MIRLVLPSDLPEVIRNIQCSALEKLGVQHSDSRALAQAVMKMSDFYVNNPEKSSPWSESWAQIAYLAYYMPLNWWRLCGVVARGRELNFFDEFEHVIEFGSGLGSLGFAFDQADIAFTSAQCLERSREAIALHQSLAKDAKTPIEWLYNSTPKNKAKTLAAFSYSFTEIDKLPTWALECDGLMIVEPSTQSDSRRLQKLRDQLIEDGWYVWGPCTHSKPCPLLVHSERDWCHDRFQWQQPRWLKEIESHMPIKNGTLPCSWLLMKKTPPVVIGSHLARMTGDLQEFKGFAKQLVCRGEQREFMSWQKKYFKKNYPDFGRGDLIVLDSNLEIKGQELRPKTVEDVQRWQHQY